MTNIISKTAHPLKIQIVKPQVIKPRITLCCTSLLKDRLAFFRDKEEIITSCANISDLRLPILEFAFANFSPFGKSAVFAAFTRGDDKYGGITIAAANPPIPQNGNEFSTVRTFTSPFQDDLVKEAMQEKGILHQILSDGEEFLSVPLIKQGEEECRGVVLLSNRFGSRKDDFTDDDIEIARLTSDIIAARIITLMPKQSPPIISPFPIIKLN